MALIRCKKGYLAVVSVLVLALLNGACKPSSKQHPQDEEVVALEEEPSQQQEEETIATDEPQGEPMAFERIKVKEANGGVKYSLSVLLPKANRAIPHQGKPY